MKREALLSVSVRKQPESQASMPAFGLSLVSFGPRLFQQLLSLGSRLLGFDELGGHVSFGLCHVLFDQRRGCPPG
jgi:hypothetical protein